MESTYKGLLIVFAILMVSPLIVAQDSSTLFFKQNVSADLIIPCVFNNTECSATASCNYSIFDPDNNEIVIHQEITVDNNSSFKITNIDTTDYGSYRVNLFCADQGFSGSDTVEYFVNQLGIESTDSRIETLKVSIYFFFILGILLFIGFLITKQSMPIKWTFFIFSVIFLLAGLNVLTVSIADEGVNPRLSEFFDGFTAIAFYFYWFAGGLLIIMWAFTFLNTWFYQKNLNNMNKYGGDFNG